MLITRTFCGCMNSQRKTYTHHCSLIPSCQICAAPWTHHKQETAAICCIKKNEINLLVSLGQQAESVNKRVEALWSLQWRVALHRQRAHSCCFYIDECYTSMRLCDAREIYKGESLCCTGQDASINSIKNAISMNTDFRLSRNLSHDSAGFATRLRSICTFDICSL